MIRQLKTLDDPLWPALVELYESTFDRDLREPTAQLEGEVLGRSRLPLCFFVDGEDGALRGFARWCDLGWSAFLIHLAVSPAIQSRGIGQGLMKAILASRTRLLLETEAEDERLMRFYGKFGARILTPTYTQPALYEDTDSVGFALVCIGDFPDCERTVHDFYRDVWELPGDHPFVVRAIEGCR